MYEVVRIIRDVPEQGVKAGAYGTLVDVLRHPKGGPDGHVIELSELDLGDRIDPTITVCSEDYEIVR